MTRHNLQQLEKQTFERPHMNTWTDSLGIKHNIHEPLLKAGPAAIAADPHQGQFRALVNDMIALRERRRRMTEKVKVKVNTRDPKAEREAERVSRAAHMPAIRQRPERPEKPAPAPLRKSLESLARDAARMAAQVRRQTEEIQRRTAIQMLGDLSAAAKAGRLGAIEAAKVDALRHANATALGLTATGVRR